MHSFTPIKIHRLQVNLQLIRQAGGWSLSQFGNLLGVSKQTVCNLENGTTKLSKLQYVGIRTILDYEISQHPENKLLPHAIYVLLDSDETTEEDVQKIKQAVAYTSGAKKLGLDSAAVFAGLSTILTIVAGAGGIIAGAGILWSDKWISEIMKND
ncbi:helix-turn-helix transcriptional regulator [Faecalibacterium sp. An192]|uniref:helix-turn-helix domain-containing protein n=1 Tax=Faecalibacterium sp. An192 TaxID=1965581 RepID=UPI000B36DE79|nr:helix-turn-helix transcriptional regulator [Faecalibacterium sp. An192]